MEEEEEVTKLIPCLILSCLQFSDIHFYLNEELKTLFKSHTFKSISSSVIHFYIAFEAEYNGIIIKAFEDPLFMKSKSRFLIEIGSRCLKMCDTPTFFSFLLMCAFIGRVVTFCYTISKCYRVVENACKCAVAIFKRKFLEFFNQENGLFGLLEYSDSLNKIVSDHEDHYEDFKDILCIDLEGSQTVIRMLNNCKNANSDKYVLTDFEIKLLYKVTEKLLKKQKPNLDFLIRRIPKNYFQMPEKEEDQNVINNVDQNIINYVDLNVINNKGENVMNNQGQNVMRNENQNVINNVDFNFEDKSNKRAANCQQSGNLLPSPSSISYRTDSYSLPIYYTIKRNPESSNCGTIENEPEVSNCRSIQNLSEPSNYSIAEKRLKQSNYFIEKKSESSDCSISEKESKPSSRGIIEKLPKLPNSCITENEIEPLNYCVAKKNSKSFNKETILEESLSLACHKTNRENLQATNYEKPSKQDNSTISLQLKHSSSVESMNTGLSKKHRIGSPDYIQEGNFAEKDSASSSKRAKISNSPRNKSTFERSFSSLQEQSLSRSFQKETEFPKKYYEYGIPSNNDYSIHNYLSTRSSNLNPLAFVIQTEAISPLSRIDSIQNPAANNLHSSQVQDFARARQDEPSLRIHSEMASTSRSSNHHDREPYITSLSSSCYKDYSIHNYPSTSSSNMNSLPLEIETEVIYPLLRTDSLKKSPANTLPSPLVQDFAGVRQDELALRTYFETVLASRGSDHHDRDPYIISSSSSSESSYSSGTQYSSEGFYSSESDIFDDSENKEFHSYTLLRHSFDMTCWDSAPSESEYYYEDRRKDVTLKSLCNRKCFHCGTKCFRYIMYVTQQFRSHFRV